MEKLDVVIIGAGVIGLTIGRELALQGREVTVLESHNSFGMGTSSRNSEVIHAGIYYPANSLKARMCVSGKAKLYDYCQERHIPFKRLGKLIVAVEQQEVETLKKYQDSATCNGVTDLEWLSNNDVLKMEPALQGVAGLFSPSTGIIDSHQLMSEFLADITNNGGTVVYQTKLRDGRITDDGVVINIDGADNFPIQCNLVINAAGLYAQSVAESLGVDAGQIPETFYAKGHYFTLTERAPFSHLIYPVANNAGLGVHLTLDLANQARFGPDVKWVDSIDYSFEESRKAEYVKAIKRYYPELNENALQAGYTGIRPKVVGPDSPPGDFMFQNLKQLGTARLVNCYGIESPGLTSSMAIAEHVARSIQ